VAGPPPPPAPAAGGWTRHGGEVASVALWCDGGVGYWNMFVVVDVVADDGVGRL